MPKVTNDNSHHNPGFCIKYVQICQGPQKVSTVSLSHEGYHSSLDGKVQKLKDKDFNKKGPASQDPVVYSHTESSRCSGDISEDLPAVHY
ncbi:hypothetical protein EB796_008270 [Bugula neritina]|uniref:Uncharacterized protein n=1 Tax=Bugula neritina TaxID=10212 RepID=A0A7J7K670_BUGNE|nr:hypothetical protein EB796_008270 [Bugula neritina]